MIDGEPRLETVRCVFGTRQQGQQFTVKLYSVVIRGANGLARGGYESLTPECGMVLADTRAMTIEEYLLITQTSTTPLRSSVPLCSFKRNNA